MIGPSRPPRCAPLLAAILCIVAMPAQAQPAGAPKPAASAKTAAKNVALLLRGAFYERGLPFFGPNAIPVLRGEYLIGGEAEDAVSAIGTAPAGSEAQAAEAGSGAATVWYTREMIVLSSAWTAVPGSANASLRILARPEGDVLYVKGEG